MQTIFLFYFLSPLSNYFSSPTITTTQRARINWKLTKHIYWKLTQNQQKINPNTSTQTNLHRDTLAKKKKTQRDRSLWERSVLDWNDRSSWVWVSPDRCLWIGAVEIDACGSELWRSMLAWSELWIGACRNDRCLTGTIGARGSRLIGAHGYGSCLIGACGSELWRSMLAWSELWIGACDRDGVD